MKNDLPFEMIYVIKTAKNKIPLGINKNLTKQELLVKAHNFKQNSNEVIISEGLSFKIILTKTPYYVVDIDENIPYQKVIQKLPFLHNTAYCKGNNKGWHFYVKINGLPEYSQEVDIGIDLTLDLLKNKNVWEYTTKSMEQDSIDEINWSDVKKHFKTEKMNFVSERQKSDSVKDDYYGECDDETLNKLIDCLSNERAENPDTWRIIGACIYNEKSVDGLPYFIKFSRKSTKHNPYDFELSEFYGNVCSRYERYTIGTLKYYAKQDSPKLYQQIYLNSVNYFKLYPQQWAEIVARQLKNTLVYSNKQWYSCNQKNVWSLIECPIYVIIENMVALIEAHVDNISLANFQNDREYMNYLKDVLKLKHKLDSGTACSQIIKHLKHLLINDDFEQTAFCIANRLIFQNGILDMCSNTFTKNILPEDMVLDKMMINWDYNPNVNEDDVRWLFEKLLQIHNNDREQLIYVLKLYGYALSACRKEALFACFKGVRTGNGKSTITDALHRICPNLVCVLPSLVLEKDFTKRHKYLAKTEGKRIVCFEELPTQKKQLDNQFLKLITGSDTYEYERMFGTTKHLNVSWTPIANTNHTPQFDIGMDMERRYREINCDNKFWTASEYATLERPTSRDFVAIPKLADKIYEKKNALLHILVDAYQQYLQNGLTTPENIKEWSNETLQENDKVETELLKRYKITFKADDYISKVEMENFASMYNVSWSAVRDLLKKKGVVYDKNKMVNRKRGFFKYICAIPCQGEEEEEEMI